VQLGLVFVRFIYELLVGWADHKCDVRPQLFEAASLHRRPEYWLDVHMDKIFLRLIRTLYKIRAKRSDSKS
jgi:hypothetical protein